MRFLFQSFVPEIRWRIATLPISWSIKNYNLIYSYKKVRTCVPFVHSHKQNEEIYGILSGKGKVVIDGEEILLTTGDWLKISPAAKRQFFAASDSGITYVCIQVKEHSLENFTATDAVMYWSKFLVYKNSGQNIRSSKVSGNSWIFPSSNSIPMWK